jgi:hypothetical protein
VSDYPQCFKCRRPASIMDRRVSPVKVVLGEGFYMYQTMLCETCQQALMATVDAWMRTTVTSTAGPGE